MNHWDSPLVIAALAVVQVLVTLRERRRPERLGQFICRTCNRRIPNPRWSENGFEKLTVLICPAGHNLQKFLKLFPRFILGLFLGIWMSLAGGVLVFLLHSRILFVVAPFAGLLLVWRHLAQATCFSEAGGISSLQVSAPRGSVF